MNTYQHFDQLHTDVMDLYQQGKFEQAYNELTEHASATDEYQEQEYLVLYLRSCLAARLERTELALELLETALDKGYWYSTQVIRQSPSWQKLQGEPAFEKLAERSIARHEEALENSKPEFLVEVPADQTGPYRPLIVLHGNGDNATNALNGWRDLAKAGWLVVAFQSGQIAAVNSYVWNDQDWAIKDIKSLLEELQKEYELELDQLVLAGFSMGGETALRVALEQHIPVKGVVLLGPGGPTIDAPQAWLPLLQTTTPLKASIIMGEADGLIESTAITELAELLREHGIPTSLDRVPGLAHVYPQDTLILRRAVADAQPLA